MDKETGMGLALSLIDEDASAAGFAGATTAATMMAIVHRRYGRPDVLEHTEVAKPVVVDDDVLVRVHAAAVHPGDYFIMTGVPTVVRLAFGLRRPRNGIRGMDVAGRVEAVGRSVQGLEPGDAVFGWSDAIPLQDRPSRARLLSDAKAGRLKVVIVDKLDRLGRTARVLLDAHDELERLGVAILSASEPPI